jgi:ElaB/YqjD/DUF883 family membrane-anchored ribosome-binding protein
MKSSSIIMTQAKPFNDRIGNTASKLEDLADNAKSYASDAAHTARGKLDDAKSVASDAAHTARGKLDDARSAASDVADTARDKLGYVRDHAGELASRAVDGAGRLTKRARGSLVHVGEAVGDMVRERPFVAIGVAAVVGAAVITLVRRSRA